MKAEYIAHMGTDLTVVNAARTVTHTRIIEAFERGYRVTKDGSLYGPKGEINVKLYGSQRYPTFTTNWGGRTFGVPAHHFAAYCFYGLDSFSPDVVIRHLNGNTLDISKQNIVLGTHSENNLDKLLYKRVRAAKAARRAQGRTPTNAKLTPEQVQEIRDAYKPYMDKKAPNGFVKDLEKKYGVCRTVLCGIKRGNKYAG